MLDVPAPLYAAMDGALAAAVPPLGRLAIWGALAGGVSMIVYHFVSPQRKIAAVKVHAAEIQRRLWAEEDFARALPLIRAQLWAAFRRVGLALPAALAALVPVITLAIWLDTSYGYALPADSDHRRVAVVPDRYAGTLTTATGMPRLRVYGSSGVVTDLTLDAAVPHVEKRRWWNALLDNPAGYLPAEGPVERVVIDLPYREYHSLGPPLARSWLAVFFPTLIVASLICHRVLKTA